MFFLIPIAAAIWMLLIKLVTWLADFPMTWGQAYLSAFVICVVIFLIRIAQRRV